MPNTVRSNGHADISHGTDLIYSPRPVSEQGIWGDCRARLPVGAMGIIKEYRIVMPVTVQEYRVAQIYMTARTQAMEAEQVRR
jgi:hypothetical protein